MPRKTDLQDKIQRLRKFCRKENRMPGYNEMLQLFGYRSKNAVHGLLLKLQKQGYVKKSGRKIAFTTRLISGIKLLGSVQAGFPSPAEEELIDTLSLDEFLVKRPEAMFMLTVSGDSMVDAGIHPGDIVLVERGVTPKANDIVIAQVDEEWTMKYFISLVIGGVVRTVIRKYD